MPSFTSRLAAVFSGIAKAFRLGPATIEPFEMSWGIPTETYKPTAYGDYQARSVGVYACTNVRARNLAGVPLRIYRGTPEDRQVVTKGAAVDLFRNVNPFWTWNRLMQMTELALCHWGEGYWVLERGANGRGVPTEIWWARPDMMRVVPDAAGYLKGFIYDERGVNLAFSPSEVIWFRYPNIVDQFSGLSPIAAARLSIETGVAALRSNKLIFDQGYQTAGIVAPAEAGQSMTAEQATMIEMMLSRRLQGGDKAHRLAVLNRPITMQPLSISPKDAEFLGLMRWSLADICRVFQVPPMLVMDFEKATYSNAEQAYKALWTDCLIPECQMIAAEVSEQLLPMFGGEATFAEFDLAGVKVLQEDQTEVTAQAQAFFAMGVPLNRVLQVFAPQLLPPGGEGYAWGDEPAGTAPAAPTPGAQQPVDDGTPAAAARQALKAVRALKGGAIAYGSPEHKAKAEAFADRIDRHKASVKRVAARLMRDQAARLVGTIKSRKSLKAPGDDPDDIWDEEAEAEAFAAGIASQLETIVDDAATATIVDLGLDITFDIALPATQAFLTERAQRFAQEVNETTWGAVKATLNEGREAGEDVDALAQRIEDTMGDRIRSSGETIARTETMGALNGGALLAAQQSGVVDGKAWLAALDGRERETHAAAHATYQARPIPLDQDFQVGAGSGPAPGAIGAPEEDINCRCTLTFTVNEDDGEERHIAPTAIAGIRAWLDRQTRP